MRKLLVGAVIMAALLTGCATQSGEVNADPHKIKYIRDNRTGLCFAVLGSRRATSINSSGLGMACVPCESIPDGMLE